LLGARKPEGLLEAYVKFLDKNPKAKGVSKLIFLGRNNKRVTGFATKHKNIYASRDYVKFEEVLVMQKLATVNVILEAKASISPFLPGKFPHCISASRP